MIEIIKYGAHWCGPCWAVGTLLTRLKKEYPEVPIRSVDIDSPEGEKACRDYKIFTIPTIIGFVNGQTATRISNVPTYEALKELISSLRSIEAEKAATTSSHG